MKADADAMWRSLIDSPDEWFDCRVAKAEGQVSAKFPDFKHMDGEGALWLDSIPEWATLMLNKGLTKWRPFEAGKTPVSLGGSREARWRSLFDSPTEWVDCRSAKKQGAFLCSQ